MYIIIQVPKKYSNDSFIASPSCTESDTTEATQQQQLQPEKKKKTLGTDHPQLYGKRMLSSGSHAPDTGAGAFRRY